MMPGINGPSRTSGSPLCSGGGGSKMAGMVGGAGSDGAGSREASSASRPSPAKLDSKRGLPDPARMHSNATITP